MKIWLYILLFIGSIKGEISKHIIPDPKASSAVIASSASDEIKNDESVIYIHDMPKGRFRGGFSSKSQLKDKSVQKRDVMWAENTKALDQASHALYVFMNVFYVVGFLSLVVAAVIYLPFLILQSFILFLQLWSLILEFWTVLIQVVVGMMFLFPIPIMIILLLLNSKVYERV